MISLPQRITGEKKRVGLYLLREIHDTIKCVSEDTGIPMSEIVSLVMREWLKEEGYLKDGPTDADEKKEDQQ